jgi:hypothetical protein
MAKSWFEQALDTGRSVLQGGATFVGDSAKTVHSAWTDANSDGHLLGPNGVVYPKGTDLSEVEHFKPSVGPDRDYTVVFVNGIDTRADALRDTCQKVADQLHVHVVGLYNSTWGPGPDFGEAIGEKLGVPGNAAVTQIAVLIEESVLTGHRLHLMGHSEGALLISHAVREMKEYLKEEMPEKAIEKAMHDNVWVDTLGGAAYTYPVGPTYAHHYNENDFVPRVFGSQELMLGPGETLHTFNAHLRDNHAIEGYLDHMPNQPLHDHDHWFGVPAFLEMQSHVSHDGDGGRTMHEEAWGGFWSPHSGETPGHINNTAHDHGGHATVTDLSGGDLDHNRRVADTRSDNHQHQPAENHHHSQDGHGDLGIHHSNE